MDAIATNYEKDSDALPIYAKETPEQIIYKKKCFYELARAICSQLEFTTHLDFGCGSGYLVEAMRNNNKESFGADIGYMYNNGIFPEIKEFVIKKSIFNYSFKKYDLVSAMEVFEHLYTYNFGKKELEKAIKNVIRTTKKYIFFTVPLLTPNYCEWLNWEGRDPKQWSKLLAKNEIPLNQDGTPLLGHVTLATEAWWRNKMDSFGLKRLQPQEKAVIGYLSNIDKGLLEWWHVFFYSK